MLEVSAVRARDARTIRCHVDDVRPRHLAAVIVALSGPRVVDGGLDSGTGDRYRRHTPVRRPIKIPFRIFAWRRGRSTTLAPILPEFGVRVVLRKGDKIVRRSSTGRIVILRVTADGGDPTTVEHSTDEVFHPEPHE